MSPNTSITYPGRFTDASELTGEEPTRNFTEIKIPMPWGHISGKWYGPTNIQPVLGIHGWQDNAGTFDTLTPLLPPDIAFLSIDLPGHGLSSPLPDGCQYNLLDYVIAIKLIMRVYKWKKISLIGHSMSGIIAFLFASLHPEETNMIISIDSLKPHQHPIKSTIRAIAFQMEMSIIEDERNRSKIEPPSYTYDEIREKFFQAYSDSIDRDRCKHILARNIQRSKKNPGKYFFCFDRRVKYYNNKVSPHELTLEMARCISAPHMFIQANTSSLFEEKKYFDEVLDVLLKKKNFQYVVVEGKHHVHLNNPSIIIDAVNSFIQRHVPKQEVSKL